VSKGQSSLDRAARLIIRQLYPPELLSDILEVPIKHKLADFVWKELPWGK
jgi:hypothetical protein